MAHFTKGECKIIFYISTDNGKTKYYFHELPPEYKPVVDESIKKVWKYKCPMTTVQQNDYMLHHAFVVFLTNNYYWSVEKDGDDIVIQISKQEELVLDNHCNGRRKKEVTLICSDYGDKTVKKLIVFLSMFELSNELFLVSTNTDCKGFADRVYKFIVIDTVPVGSNWGVMWTSEIYFYPKFRDQRQYRMNEDWSFLNFQEPITTVWKYKTPLSWFQLTDFIFHHRYVVFQTASYHWSIEKYAEGIVIQIYQDKDTVVLYKHDGVLRNNYPTILESCDVPSSKQMTVRDLLDYIRDNELSRGFNFFSVSDNCKGFADRIYYKLK